MVIQISINTTEPLAGTAASERGSSIPFTGWFELLRAISALIEPTTIPDERGRQHSVVALGRCEQEHDRS